MIRSGRYQGAAFDNLVHRVTHCRRPVACRAGLGHRVCPGRHLARARQPVDDGHQLELQSTVPTGIATFTNNGAPTAVTISGTTSINTLNFTAAAPAYSFTIGNAATFTINQRHRKRFRLQPGLQRQRGGNAGARGWRGRPRSARSRAAGAVIIGPTDPGTLLAIVGSSSTTFSGSFSGAGSLELDNIGTSLTLTGASNGGNIGTIGGDLTLCDCFAGGLTISGGSLTVGGSGPFGGVHVMGGTLSVINGGTLQIGSLATPAALLVASQHDHLRPRLQRDRDRRPDRHRHFRADVVARDQQWRRAQQPGRGGDRRLPL